MADYHPIDITVYPQIFQQFATYKTVIQGRSPATVEDYLSDLSLFFRVYKYLRSSRAVPLEDISIDNIDVPFLEQVTRSEVFAVFNYLVNERGNKVCARARKLSALKSFYKYLTVTEKLFENNPVRDIESPKQSQKLPKYLTLEECVLLLRTIAADADSPTRDRDFAMVTLFLNCGMRLSELVGISTTDIDRDMKTLRVLGKGSKERIIYLNDACRAALNAYLPIRAAMADRIRPEDKQALFLSTRRNQRISQKTVQYIVYKYLDMAGLGHKKLSTHKLRHTAATLMYQSGSVDIRVLKDILGHEQLNTTQIYTHVSDASMQRAVDANPLANLKIKKTAADNED
ncbi:MAG: tyrosine recombinase XerC [Ruminococcaceae bacterium]|nr:tyrosine recombinase XerC [Oscillospiraceae bacterium]